MFQEVDPVLGPEMRSTGEVLGIATTTGEAFFKAEEAAKAELPLGGTALLSVNEKDKPEIVEVARSLANDGFKLIATGRTCDIHDDSYLRKAAIKHKIPYITTIAAAKAAAEGIAQINGKGRGEVKSLQAWHAEIKEK